MEEKDNSGSGSLDINSGTDSPPFSDGVNVSVDVAPAAVAVLLPQQQQSEVLNAGDVGSGDLVKKKRGRPRKYDADGNLRVPAANKITTSPSLVSPTGFSISHPSSGYSSGISCGRGRPPGSGNWQLLASLGGLFADTAGGDFTPHVINVYTGEGRFEILTLAGSFTMSEHGGVKSRTGGLSVSLAGPDGRVIGGGITGTLVAASPIQSVVGSFMPDAYKTYKRKQQYEARMISPIQGNSDLAAARPNIQASTETNASQFLSSHFQEQNQVEADSSINKVGSYCADWNVSEVPTEQKPSPDINMVAPDE